MVDLTLCTFFVHLNMCGHCIYQEGRGGNPINRLYSNHIFVSSLCLGFYGMNFARWYFRVVVVGCLPTITFYFCFQLSVLLSIYL